MVKIADVLNSSPKGALDTWKMLCGAKKMALPYLITLRWLWALFAASEIFALWIAALPIAAAALDWEEPNGGWARVVFFVPMCWGALAVAAGWHVAMDIGAPFLSLLLPRLCSTACSWASRSSPRAVFVHLPGWKVFCCKGLISVQGSVKRVRGCEW